MTRLKLTSITWNQDSNGRLLGTVKLSNEGKALLSVVKGRQKRALKHAILRHR